MIGQRDYSLIGEDSRLAVEHGLATADWYRTPVERKRMKELMQRSDGRAIRDTVVWLGSMVVLGGLAVHLWWSWWCVPLLLVYGVLYGSASDARWHEAGHGTAFRTPWMNTVVYQIACFMMIRNPTAWRWSHTRHHTDTLIVGRDPEIVAMRPPRIGVIAMNFLGLVDAPHLLATTVRHAFGRLTPDELTYIPESERASVYRVARVWLVLYGAVLAACFSLGSILPVVLIGLPRLYGAWHHLLTGLAQHGGLAENVTDHRLNSRTIYMNPISRFIYWNMNYHIEHHMFPMVPFHQLPALHEEIKADLPAPYVSVLSAYREFVPILFKQRRDQNVFIHVVVPESSAPSGSDIT